MAMGVAAALHDLERQVGQLANEIGTLYDHNLPRVAGSIASSTPPSPKPEKDGRPPETVLERILEVSSMISRMGRAVVDMNGYLNAQLSSDVTGSTELGARPSSSRY